MRTRTNRTRKHKAKATLDVTFSYEPNPVLQGLCFVKVAGRTLTWPEGGVKPLDEVFLN